MGGHIDAYIDIASLYSYLAFVLLRKDEEILAGHGVEIEFHPVLLGAINVGAGNKPPWTLPAKAKYGIYDARRSWERAGVPETRPPADIMPVSHTILPLRALHYIKLNYPKETYETAWDYLFHAFWTPPNANLTDRAVFARALAEAPVGFRSTDKSTFPSSDQKQQKKLLFSRAEIDAILAAAGSPEMKEALKAATGAALGRGAFGAPWLWVRNGAGEEEPFFGSDRFHFVYKFLGLPFQDVKLLPAAAKL